MIIIIIIIIIIICISPVIRSSHELRSSLKFGSQSKNRVCFFLLFSPLTHSHLGKNSSGKQGQKSFERSKQLVVQTPYVPCTVNNDGVGGKS